MVTITLTEKEEQFVAAYFEAVCFTEELAHGELDSLWVREQIIDCLCFYNIVKCYLPEGTTEQAGHDFWFTRNGHGVGFWDRPEIYGNYFAEDMTKKSKRFAEVDVITIEEQ